MIQNIALQLAIFFRQKPNLNPKTRSFFEATFASPPFELLPVRLPPNLRRGVMQPLLGPKRLLTNSLVACISAARTKISGYPKNEPNNFHFYFPRVAAAAAEWLLNVVSLRFRGLIRAAKFIDQPKPQPKQPETTRRWQSPKSKFFLWINKQNLELVES